MTYGRKSEPISGLSGAVSCYEVIVSANNFEWLLVCGARSKTHVVLWAAGRFVPVSLVRRGGAK